MKKVNFLILLCLCIVSQVNAQRKVNAHLEPQVRIAQYKGDCAAAISYTFDDGLLEQYTELFPQLKKYGIKASFCVNGNTINRYEHLLSIGDTTDVLIKEKPRMTWKMMREMSDQGQEITSHGWAHINVKKLEGEALRYEVQHNDTVIWQHTGIFPRTYFYPGNAKSPEKVAYCEQNRVGTRTEQVSIGSKRDEAWLKQWVEGLIRDRKWGVGMTHGISRGYDHFKNPQVLWNHFEYISRLRDSVWVGTFHDVSAYVKERDAIKLKTKVRKDKIIVTPSLSLDKELFHEPLTLVVEHTLLSASQDGKQLAVLNKNGQGLVDIDPQGGKVSLVIKREATPVYIVAGQSNTDGRVGNELLPEYIQTNKYHHCYWSYGSGAHSGEGKFELFWPRIYNSNKPGRWAYDAVLYYWLEQSLKRDFYVIKESLGGTAIDTRTGSTNKMYWSASPEYLASTAASDKGGKSLLKAFVDNIGACIDKQLSKQKGGYDIKAFIWHQGESDRHVSRYYYDNMKAVIAYVRQYLVKKTGNKRYANLPVIMGSIPHAGRGYAAGVEEAQMRLTREDKNVYLIDVHDAPLQRDNIHFDATGAELLGRKMYNKLVSLHLAGKNAKSLSYK